MARLPRLAIGGLPHLVTQRPQHRQPMLLDEVDGASFVRRLQDNARQCNVAVHAYGVGEAGFGLVATPADASGLSRLMQTLARGHAHAFNRRHGRTGGLWSGRFQAAPLEPGPWLLPAMHFVERLATNAGATPVASGWPSSSFDHHVGRGAQPWIADPPVYWELGNTPFDREAHYADQHQQALTSDQVQAIEHALRGGWLLGSADFGAQLELEAGARATRPQPRGRPRRTID